MIRSYPALWLWQSKSISIDVRSALRRPMLPFVAAKNEGLNLPVNNQRLGLARRALRFPIAMNVPTAPITAIYTP